MISNDQPTPTNELFDEAACEWTLDYERDFSGKSHSDAFKEGARWQWERMRGELSESEALRKTLERRADHEYDQLEGEVLKWSQTVSECNFKIEELTAKLTAAEAARDNYQKQLEDNEWAHEKRLTERIKELEAEVNLLNDKVNRRSEFLSALEAKNTRLQAKCERLREALEDISKAETEFHLCPRYARKALLEQTEGKENE